MTGVAAPHREAHALRPRTWPEPEREVRPAAGDPRTGLAVTTRCVRRDGQPWLPISGEVHYSRLTPRQWPLALQLLRAGGITLVSTYVFWNHHQPVPDRDPDFTGHRDVAAFLRLCAGEDLPVIIRIGPWCHGEVRHGGFPDWVQASGFALRSDDPGYLALVRSYWSHLAREIGWACGPDGPVVAVQVENELYDDPQHLATLKGLAQEVGITAPLWTATGWGNARLPLPEVFPVYSGYSDGFWVDAEDGWDASFRSHFLFSDRWDDPGVGKDLAGDAWTGVAGDKHPDLPPATCELAGGMATAYHCRPVPSALDVAALANVKLGSGSAWQGYYMFVGGTNPSAGAGPDGLQESHATGYPNDLPTFDYDFGAPIGRDLRTRESFARLRLQHSFVDAFGPALATMPTTFPEPPTEDRPLRWCVRSDGSSGYVFVNNHQPHEPLAAVPGVRFAVDLDDERIAFPPEPVDVPASAVLALPVAHVVGGVTLRWATVNLITRLDAPEPVLVAHAHPGLRPELGLPAGHRVSGAESRRVGDELVVSLVPGRDAVTVESPAGDRLHLIVLSPAQALRAWTPTVAGHRLLLLSGSDVVQRDGRLVALPEGPDTVSVLDPITRRWTDRSVCGGAVLPVPYRLVDPLPSGHAPPRSSGGRASAPSRGEIAEYSARYRLPVPEIPADVERAALVVDLVGDVAEIALAGTDEPFDDLFWAGSAWRVDLTRFAGAGPLDLELRLTAFPPPAVPIRLDPDADRARLAHPGVSVTAAELRLTRTAAIARPTPSAEEA